MKIKLLLFFSFAITISNFVFSQEQTFKLKDGTVISGTVQEETDLTMQVQTKFGLVTINKNELIHIQYEVNLQSGETLIGFKIDEDSESIKLKTQMGELTIQKSNIINIQEMGTKANTENKSSTSTPHRSYGLTDFLFSGMKIDKDTDFALGEEQLTDLFFDPTGYTFEQSTLYLSGLSFGFGVFDRFQITTKWWGFFYGDLNLRPKFKLFEKGNWENQQSLSIGAHYHTRWKPNKHEWKSGSVQAVNFNGEHRQFGVDDCPGDGSEYCWKQTAVADTVTKYWGGFYPIGKNPSYTDLSYKKPEDYDPNATDVYYDYEPWIVNYNEDDEEKYIEMIELFGAYTYSTARSNLKGRISHTIGGNVQYVFFDETQMYYRIYYGLDVDINPRLKMIGENDTNQILLASNKLGWPSGLSEGPELFRL